MPRVRERDKEGRPVWQQTGPQDPRVTEVIVPGQLGDKTEREDAPGPVAEGLRRRVRRRAEHRSNAGESERALAAVTDQGATMSKTDYSENKVLDHLNGKASFAMPTAYVALFTAAPSDAGGGTEVTGGSYARVATSGATWTAASGGSTSNAAAVTFPTASASWGTVTHYATFDAATSGNMLRWAALTAPKTIGSGDTASFAIGALTQTED